MSTVHCQLLHVDKPFGLFFIFPYDVRVDITVLKGLINI